MMKFLTAKITKNRREVCKGKSNVLGAHRRGSLRLFRLKAS
jgi:hypothetical protein